MSVNEVKEENVKNEVDIEEIIEKGKRESFLKTTLTE